MEFQKFDKIPRLSRDIVITEKIDGTNAQIYIVEFDNLREVMGDGYSTDWLEKYLIKMERNPDEDKYYYIFAGSRTRWLDITSKGDNFGFAKWVQANAEQLLGLGEGRHYGEWYGRGIQRGYGLDEKRFALFNTGRWLSSDTPIEVGDKRENCPECCDLVPILYKGLFNTKTIQDYIDILERVGSFAVPGFMKPEGLVIFHTASGQLFKKTVENDEKPKCQK